MIDLITPIYKMKEKKIKRYSCFVNRASGIGYFVPELNGCLRRGVFTRTKWKDQELHSIETQLIFDEGNNQERTVLIDLAQAGIDIIEQQFAYEWKEYQITGHCDGKVYYTKSILNNYSMPLKAPLEIKSMHPVIFDQIDTYNDLKKYPWTRSYMSQINLYMLMDNVPNGILLLKNKSTGALKQINVELDYTLGEQCIRTCEAINKHIKNETIPDKIIDISTCKKCPFKLICLPDIQMGTIPLEFIDNNQLEGLVKKYIIEKAKEKNYKNIHTTLKMYLQSEYTRKGELNISLGDYLITGGCNKSGNFNFKVKD